MSNLASKSSKHSVFSFSEAKGSRARQAKRQQRELRRQFDKQKQKVKNTLELPAREFNDGGDPSPGKLWGCKSFKVTGRPVTSHTAATAYPYVAGPSLGYEGAMIGHDLHGGGSFCFDPWVLYGKGLISGMSMLLFGQVGTGKSSLAKSLAVRLVLYGRKLSVASDKKGEWTAVVRALGGNVIQVGPGLTTRLNPLDTGVRPSLNVRGEPLTDEQWRQMVRARRMLILTTIVKILTEQRPDSAEHLAISDALDMAVDLAHAEDRVPTIPDLITGLNKLKTEHRNDHRRSDAANVMAMTLYRVTGGGLEGMFDGPSTVEFDVDAPAVSIDTSSARGADPIAVRIINACAGSWMESMVTNSDAGQRVVVYEEGWDNISSEADLQRMVEQWKLARSYGLFNILVMHKVSDLNMAGDQGSRMVSMAKSLLADADIKVIYRQDATALRVTTEEMELTTHERGMLRTLEKGTGLWRIGEATFEVANELTAAEIPLFDTDSRMDKHDDDPDELIEGAAA